MRTSEPPHSRAMRHKIRPLAAASGRALLFAGLFMATFTPAHPEPERVVNFYNWSDYIDPVVLDSFTAETGIKVRYDTFDSNDTLEAKLLAGKSGYDVVVPSGYFLARQIAAGIFRKLDKSKLPNLANAWPEIAARLASYDPGNQYAVNYMWGTTGIGYNVNAVRALLGEGAAINSWDEIFESSAGSRIAAFTSSTHPTTSCRRRCIICSSIRIRARPTICSALLISFSTFGLTYGNSTPRNISTHWPVGKSAWLSDFQATLSRRDAVRPRPRRGWLLLTQFPKKARNCGSITSPFPAMRPTSPRRMP
jgi:hypothetical protein